MDKLLLLQSANLNSVELGVLVRWYFESFSETDIMEELNLSRNQLYKIRRSGLKKLKKVGLPEPKRLIEPVRKLRAGLRMEMLTVDMSVMDSIKDISEHITKSRLATSIEHAKRKRC